MLCSVAGADTFVIRDEAVLKVVADPLRRRILLYLGQPRTIGDVAGLLDQRPQKLHYHFELLAKHGLIHVAGHRTSGNHVERLYEVAARSFRVEPSLATAIGYGVNLAVQTVLEEATARYSQGRSALEQAGLTDRFSNYQVIVAARLTQKQVAEVQRELQKAVEQFQAAEDEEGSAWYALTLVMHPAGPDPLSADSFFGEEADG